MNKTSVLSALPLLVLAACAHDGVAVREVGSVHADSSDGTTDGRLAIGLGQLAVGNVALALETFRRAAREDPGSANALAGMADCYKRMGRLELARRYLEQALALRPQQAGLYRALAEVSEGEGKVAEAAALRREAQLRSVGRTSAAASVTVAIAPTATVPAAASTRAAAPAAPTVTIDLPAPTPAAAPAPAPVEAASAPPRMAEVAPRLVRMSLGEVMLVTSARAPFDMASVRIAADTIHAPLRILNAARIQGIAARTRLQLAARGVRGIEIGNAPGRQSTSELRFAAADRGRAERIASRLPFPVVMTERAGSLVLLLGRDAGKRA